MEEAKKKKKFKIKKIKIHRDICKSCGICVDFCPTRTLISDEYGRPQIADIELCNGCELCVVRCPDMAIEIEKEKGKEGADHA